MTRRFVVAAGGLLGALAIVAVSGPAGATPTTTRGPSFGRFTISFPSAPKSESNTKEVLSGFPAGVKSATAYWVSPVADPLGSSSAAPPAPSYLVVVGRAKSTKQAGTFTSAIKRVPGTQKVTVNGATGYRFVGTEKELSQSAAKDPGATEAFMYLSRSTTLYAVIVISDNHAQALSFLGSFRPG
jgi:hypothetical protein